MDNQRPRVSVGLPAFNGEKYLPKALDSLLAQDYEDFELIISDNASTDETGRICEKYARQDGRIRYSRNPSNIGLAPNHNRVFTLARGEFFKWAACDDEYPRQMLKRYMEAFDAAPPSVSVVYSVCEYIDELGNPLGTYSDHVDTRNAAPARRLAHLLQHINIYNWAYGLIRSEMLRKTRLLGSFPIADRVLFGELAMLGVFVELSEPLLRLRIHEGRSFTHYKDAQSLRALFDPANKTTRPFLSIEGRVQLELLRSAWQIPTRLSDKLTCVCAAVAAENWRKFKSIGGRQKRKLRCMIARARRRKADTGRLKV
jgi:glycosyltransferase involved in cell wall biosynthesis